MNFFYQFTVILLLVSCNYRGQKTRPQSEDQSLTYQSKFCNGSISFDESASTAYIVIDLDTISTLKSVGDYFHCLKEEVNNDRDLKARFIKNSNHIYFELASSASIKMTHLNLELINYADTSKYWTGQNDMRSRNEGFFEFIFKSGYANHWEKVFDDILGKQHKWEYGAEKIFYISNAELSASIHKEYKKNIYPHSFELYLSR